MPSVPKQVALGARGGCGLLQDGQLWCWEGGAEPHVVSNLPPLRSFSMHKSLGCGLSEAGDLWCVAAKAVRRVGQQPSSIFALADGQVCVSNRGASVTCFELPTVSGEPSLPGEHPRERSVPLPAMALASRGAEVCALDDTSQLACWSPASEGPSYLDVPRGVRALTSLSGSDSMLCAVAEGEWVRCWDGAPSRAAVGADAIELALDGLNGCALEKGRTVRCWGPSGFSGRLAGLGGVLGISMANGTLCARDAAGWRCWSSGSGAKPPASLADDPRQISSKQNYTRAAIGGSVFCGVDPSKNLHCLEQSRDATTQGRPLFELANTLSVTLGRSHGCAQLEDKSLWCFGANESGQVDVSAQPIQIDTPVRVLPDVVTVAIGLSHTCAATVDGNVRCWGDDTSAQLGQVLGTAPAPSGVPVPLPGKARQVAAGRAHSCALLDDGGVYCWGHNNAGQLGQPPGPGRFPPTRVPLDGRVVALASEDNTTCAAVDSIGLACWGSTYRCSAVSEGVCEQKTTPTIFRLNEPVAQLAVAQRHTCVLLASGSVSCVGSNESHQLGAILPIKRVVHESHHAESCNRIEWVEARGSSEFVPVAW